MKKLIYYTLIVFLASLFYSCGCNKDYVEEAKAFDKDTALMHTWKNTQENTTNSLYYTFENTGNLLTKSIESNTYYKRGVWYTKNNIINIRACGAESGEYDRVYAKYSINNDTLFLTFRSGVDDNYMKDPIVYIKVSNNP